MREDAFRRNRKKVGAGWKALLRGNWRLSVTTIAAEKSGLWESSLLLLIIRALGMVPIRSLIVRRTNATGGVRSLFDRIPAQKVSVIDYQVKSQRIATWKSSLRFLCTTLADRQTFAFVHWKVIPVLRFSRKDSFCLRRFVVVCGGRTNYSISSSSVGSQ